MLPTQMDCEVLVAIDFFYVLFYNRYLNDHSLSSALHYGTILAFYVSVLIVCLLTTIDRLLARF